MEGDLEKYGEDLTWVWQQLKSLASNNATVKDQQVLVTIEPSDVDHQVWMVLVWKRRELVYRQAKKLLRAHTFWVAGHPDTPFTLTWWYTKLPMRSVARGAGPNSLHQRSTGSCQSHLERQEVAATIDCRALGV